MWVSLIHRSSDSLRKVSLDHIGFDQIVFMADFYVCLILTTWFGKIIISVSRWNIA